MAASKLKAEIQVLTSLSSDYLSRVYLPNKLQFGGWLWMLVCKWNVFLHIDLFWLHLRKKSAETKEYLSVSCSVSLSLYLEYNFLFFFVQAIRVIRIVLLPFCGFCCETVPNAMVHTEKIMKYVLSSQKNVKFKNASRNCFAFCLKAQDDAFYFWREWKTLLRIYCTCLVLEFFFRCSIVGFCKFRPKSQK